MQVFEESLITASYAGMEARIHAEAGYSGYQEYGTRFQPGTSFMLNDPGSSACNFREDMTNVMKGVFKWRQTMNYLD